MGLRLSPYIKVRYDPTSSKIGMSEQCLIKLFGVICNAICSAIPELLHEDRQSQQTHLCYFPLRTLQKNNRVPSYIALFHPASFPVDRVGSLPGG
jgi:hypothetical protein